MITLVVAVGQEACERCLVCPLEGMRFWARSEGGVDREQGKGSFERMR